MIKRNHWGKSSFISMKLDITMMFNNVDPYTSYMVHIRWSKNTGFDAKVEELPYVMHVSIAELA